MQYNQNDYVHNPNPKPKKKPPKTIVSQDPVRDYDKEFEEWLEYQMYHLDDPDFYIHCSR